MEGQPLLQQVGIPSRLSYFRMSRPFPPASCRAKTRFKQFRPQSKGRVAVRRGIIKLEGKIGGVFVEASIGLTFAADSGHCCNVCGTRARLDNQHLLSSSLGDHLRTSPGNHRDHSSLQGSVGVQGEFLNIACLPVPFLTLANGPLR